MQNIHFAFRVDVGSFGERINQGPKIQSQICSFGFFVMLLTVIGDLEKTIITAHVLKNAFSCIFNYVRILNRNQVTKTKAGLHVIGDSRWFCVHANWLFCKLFHAALKEFHMISSFYSGTLYLIFAICLFLCDINSHVSLNEILWLKWQFFEPSE